MMPCTTEPLSTMQEIDLCAIHIQQRPRSACTDVVLSEFCFLLTGSVDTIGIKHVFSCINIRQVPWEVLKTEAFGLGFQHLPRDLANVNALKKHV